MVRPVMIFVLGLYAFQGRAQTTNATETIIRTLEQKIVQAILDGDTNTLKTLWDPEYVVNTPRNDIARGREAVLANQKSGLINYSSFRRIVELIQVREKTVITIGYETFISRNDIPGAKAGQEVKRRFTNVWMKKKGKWLQVARHASIICSQ